MGHEPMPEKVRRRTSRKTVLAIGFAVAGILGVLAPSALACPSARTGAAFLTTEQARASVICLINKQRSRSHVKPVHEDAALDSAAQSHTNAMTSGNFFSHEGDGTPASRASNAGYMAGASAWGVGEDLFTGAAKRSTPTATVRGWMHSAPHRTVLLSRSYRQVGVGVLQGSPFGADNTNTGTYTGLFGFRKGG